jgi:hypothetical protein
MDQLQQRKCVDFKRMLLESCSRGSAIGVPIPIGYDDVQDIESWPLLQAFALEDLLPSSVSTARPVSTGFFSSYFSVVDVTEYLDILFRTVDMAALDRAIVTVRKSVVPHALQFLRMIDAETAEQRASTTAEDAVGPLLMLFEFGELDAVSAVDPQMRPVCLFGSSTDGLGDPQFIRKPELMRVTAGKSAHLVVEGCEPATGVRWCRSYFLRRGKSIPYLHDAQDVIADPEQQQQQQQQGRASNTSSANSNSGSLDREQDLAMDPTLLRMQGLYCTLWLALRILVRKAFAANTDVLEAGQQVQAWLDDLLRGNFSAHLSPAAREHWGGLTCMLPSERLQVHMDCMNALGQIISIEDVDDLGGSCWTYIRVSVHGVRLPAGETGFGSVAVGDTFLFNSSSASTLAFQRFLPEGVQSASTDGSETDRTRDLFPLVGDGICLTHPIPYWHALPGAAGDEERNSERLLASIRNPLMWVTSFLSDCCFTFSVLLMLFVCVTGFRQWDWGKPWTTSGRASCRYHSCPTIQRSPAYLLTFDHFRKDLSWSE